MAANTTSDNCVCFTTKAKLPQGLVVNATGVLRIGASLLSVLSGKDLSKMNAAEVKDDMEDRIKIPTGINPKNLHKYSLYEILGLGKWADCADMEIIKKAYHKAVLIYHPDKQPFTSNGKEDRSVFLKVQEAYSTLCNEDKRRAYDSQLPFDETIPDDDKVQAALNKGHEHFLQLFDDVFKRNARFAVMKPVPEIGTVATPMENVYAFYEYWTKFESWRDFTGVGAEYDPDNAQDRYEKRSIQKENEKLAKKLKKKEMERIITLVTKAQTSDPRIIQDKINKKLAKEAKQREREEQQRAKELAEKEAAEKAERERAEAHAIAKADKEAFKKLQSKTRIHCKKLLRGFADARKANGTLLTTSVKSEYGEFTYDEIETKLFGCCGIDELGRFNDILGGEIIALDPQIVSIMSAWSSDEQKDRLQQITSKIVECRTRQIPSPGSSKSVSPVNTPPPTLSTTAKTGANMAAGTVAPATAVERQWKRDDLSALSKCIRKFPAGCKDRWQGIAMEMNHLLKPSIPFTVDECLKISHNIVKMMGSAK